MAKNYYVFAKKFQKTINSQNRYTFVEWALEGAEISLKDIEAVSLGKSPGSYTDLELAQLLQKVLLWFESSSHCCQFSGNDDRAVLGQNYDVIIPLIDARRMEVYCAVFDGNSGEMLTETEAKILDEQSFKN